MSTIFIRQKKQRDYTVVDNLYLRDDSLSWKAKGLFTYLLSLPEDWQIHLEEIEKHAPDGRDSLRAAIRELKSKGYVILRQRKDLKGKFSYSEFEIIERPEPLTDNPHTENPLTGNPTTENPKLLSTNRLSTNKQNTNSTLGIEIPIEKKPKRDDEVSKIYHEAIKEIKLPTRNHNNLRKSIERLQREIGKDKAIAYLVFLRTNYLNLKDDGFKPQLNESLDIYAKRVAIQSWIERMIADKERVKTVGGRPIF